MFTAEDSILVSRSRCLRFNPGSR